MNTIYNLSIANPQFNESLKKYESDLRIACDYFNSQSAKARTPKSLRIIEIKDTYMTVELCSNSETSAKSLRIFTKYILDNSSLAEYSYHTTLFKSIQVALPTKNTNESEKPEISVMKNLTQLMIGDSSNSKEFFTIIDSLFKHTYDMEPQCKVNYLHTVQKYIDEQASLLGH